MLGIRREKQRTPTPLRKSHATLLQAARSNCDSTPGLSSETMLRIQSLGLFLHYLSIHMQQDPLPTSKRAGETQRMPKRSGRAAPASSKQPSEGP